MTSIPGCWPVCTTWGPAFGLAGVRLFRLAQPDYHLPASFLPPQDWFWLLAAIAAGGLAAPVLLMFGLTATPAAVASLLLNLEGVFTALLALVFFQEQYDRRIVLGLATITAGAVLLAGTGTWTWSSFWGPLAVAGACLAWSLDNKLSRKVALGDPVWIAMVKGLAAGGTNLSIAS